ncbi:MAG: hypothetical protein ACOYN3_10525, partial [Acidimicrobiia bacterium]
MSVVVVFDARLGSSARMSHLVDIVAALRPRATWGDALELSDLIVDIDPVTLTRRPVRVADVSASLAETGDRWAIRLLHGLPSSDGYLHADAVDALLVRVHT